MSASKPGCSGVGAAALAALWPARNILKMLSADGQAERTCNLKGKYSGGPLRPYHDRLSDYVGVQAGQIPKVLLAIVVWYYTVDFKAAEKGFDFSFNGWCTTVILRDLFLMVAITGVWDWILYFSPLKERLAPYKFNSAYPKWTQLQRDIFWTFIATLLASAQEILVMRWWASGQFTRTLFGQGGYANDAITKLLGGESAVAPDKPIPWETPFFGSEYTVYFVIWTVTMLYWRILHFYIIHRGMHPWWDRKNGLLQGDVGAFLYRYVHSHHHKSYNPTAFSGFSMTPVESILYISAALIPLCFRSGCHPWLHLYTKIDLIVGAQIGHDGFDAPGGGSYFHQLHHAYFECNYGDAAGIPMDWLMGTFEDGSKREERKQ